jgi:5-methylcytosine-specific restriction endonuclease McrA
MPSSPGYVRDIAQETKTAEARGERGGSDSPNAKRSKLRRQMIKAGKASRNDGKDIDHKTPLSKGGANTMANARVVSKGTNRSFPRNSDGSMKRS